MREGGAIQFCEERLLAIKLHHCRCICPGSVDRYSRRALWQGSLLPTSLFYHCFRFPLISSFLIWKWKAWVFTICAVFFLSRKDFQTQLRIFLLQEGDNVKISITARIVFHRNVFLKGPITRSAKVCQICCFEIIEHPINSKWGWDRHCYLIESLLFILFFGHPFPWFAGSKR